MSIFFSSKMQHSGCELVGKNVMPIHFTVLSQFINFVCSSKKQKLEIQKMMTSFPLLHTPQISVGFMSEKKSPQTYNVYLNTRKHGI